MLLEKINTKNAPQPAGHYAQAVVHNGLVYVSGQLPVIPENPREILPSIEEQTKQVLINIKSILNASGSDLTKVIKTTVYVSDITLWDRVNKVYSEFFGSHYPARVIVPTRELHFGFKIEMDAIAAIS